LFAGGSDFDYSPHSLISAPENILIEYQGTEYSLELYFIFLEPKDDFSFIAFSGGWVFEHIRVYLSRFALCGYLR
jgi:hypothetical protein